MASWLQNPTFVGVRVYTVANKGLSDLRGEGLEGKRVDGTRNESDEEGFQKVDGGRMTLGGKSRSLVASKDSCKLVNR